jgi:hypothetical protein
MSYNHLRIEFSVFSTYWTRKSGKNKHYSRVDGK